MRCHLLLQSPQALQRMQQTDYCEAVRRHADVYAFTMDEVWSQQIVLDREPITAQSERHVHLVVMGMGSMAEMVAIHAAHTAHYPNYVHDHRLRTRITMVDERPSAFDAFIGRYRHLFDNSYYRMVKPGDEQAVKSLHRPMYEGRREDFVDVEWEFVEAASEQETLRQKLALWASDERQLLTIVVAYPSAQRNMSEALRLPDAVFRQAIPVYVYTKGEAQATGCELQGIRLFGMTDHGYDVTLPYVRMAKNVNYIYDRCYAENFAEDAGDMPTHLLRYAAEIDPDERDRSWDRLSNAKRQSNIRNAMTIASKMRSVGLGEDEWERFYDIAQHDIELLAQVEHNRWSVEELILGWRPCSDEQQQAVENDIAQKRVLKQQKVHYDLRAYNDLRPDETGKSVKVYDRCLCSCLPLIAKAFADEKGGEA